MQKLVNATFALADLFQGFFPPPTPEGVFSYGGGVRGSGEGSVADRGSKGGGFGFNHTSPRVLIIFLISPEPVLDFFVRFKVLTRNV